MAIYHCSIKVLSKSSGRSAVQFSAYMSGEKDYSELTGEIYDHTSKEEVIYSDMIFSDNVPNEIQNKHDFWNSLETNEKNQNAQLSRVYELALPKEFSQEENIALTEEYAKSLLADGYSAVQIAVHDKEDNPHAHIMCPIRQMNEKGEWDNKKTSAYLCENEQGEQKAFKSVKDIEEGYRKIPILDEQKLNAWESENNKKFDYHKESNEELKKVIKTDNRNRQQFQRTYIEANTLNDKSRATEWRQRWEDIENEHIKFHNMAHEDNVELVSSKTLKEQGIEREATIHEGFEARKIEREGGISERCEFNRGVKERNELRLEISNLENNILEQQGLIDKLKQQFTEFLEEMKNGIHRELSTAAERLRAAINPGSRTSGEVEPGKLRSEIRERISIAENTFSDRAARELEQQRYRIEAEQRAKELERARIENERREEEELALKRARAHQIDYGISR